MIRVRLTPDSDYRDVIPTKLRGGEEIFLSPVDTGDVDRIIAGLHLLSDQSLYTRFFTGNRPVIGRFKNWLLGIDQKNHVAWGAFDPDRSELPGIGIMHLIKLPEKHGYAEFAVTVIDEYQQKGLGTHFLALVFLLSEGLGIHTLTATIIQANHFIIEQFLALGGHISERIEHDVTLELSLQPNWESQPMSDERKAFKETVERLKIHFL